MKVIHLHVRPTIPLCSSSAVSWFCRHCFQPLHFHQIFPAE